jgi:hypothetical protein
MEEIFPLVRWLDFMNGLEDGAKQKPSARTEGFLQTNFLVASHLYHFVLL